MQNDKSVKIVERFFEALQELKQRKSIRGKATFAKKYGINRRNLYQLDQDKSRDILQLIWLSYLVTDYGVSADWLLTGEGGMFSTPKT